MMGRKHVRFIHYIKIDVLFHLPYQPRRLTLELRNNCHKTNAHFYLYTLYISCTCKSQLWLVRGFCHACLIVHCSHYYWGTIMACSYHPVKSVNWTTPSLPPPEVGGEQHLLYHHRKSVTGEQHLLYHHRKSVTFSYCHMTWTLSTSVNTRAAFDLP